MNRKVELLAPAGDFERLKWAIMYGADAIYLGGINYSLRANAKNFTLQDIKNSVNYAHQRNVNVYVTVNIVFHNIDVNELTNYLTKLDKIGVDGIIFSDPLIIDIVKQNNLKLQLHLSTQASVLNRDAALYFKKHGVSRIVLARECSKNDIESIINQTGIEIECFIHGAMCSNISGRCVLSNYFTNRDANRGGCCQVCRFNFNLFDSNKKLLSKTPDFAIAPKDLTLVNYINDMIKIGITSFKLEGRMRSIYYVATLLSVYRRLIDMYLNNSIDKEYLNKAEKILLRCSNRDAAPQFFNKKPGVNEQYYIGRKEDSNQDFLGIVLDYDELNKEIVIEQRNYFKIGDKVNVFGPNKEDYSFVIKYIKDENNNFIDAARHPKEIIKINCNIYIQKNSILRVNFLD